MNKLIPLVLIISGAVLIVAARQDKDPRNIVFEGLGIKQRVSDPAPIGYNLHGTLQRVPGTGTSYTPDPGSTGVKITGV